VTADGPAALAGFDPPPAAETIERLVALVALLRRWQAAKNLVGPRTLDEVWARHVADSWQLAGLAPLDATWADLGSGAGFPGLVIAAAMRQGGAGHVHLIESNGRKCAFLREAARMLALPATVHDGRAEAVLPGLPGVRVVTARALAPLVDLLALAAPVVEKGGLGLFPKGREAQRELTEAARRWTFTADSIPSRTDSSGVILRIAGVARRA
jgi:16S rRNA (guanine527-N7)-methyltransferase